jgi:hypothetical protein
MGRAVPSWANPNAIPDIYKTDAQRKLWQQRQRETQGERRDAAMDLAKKSKQPGGSALNVLDYRLTDAELKSLLPKPPPKPKPTAPTPAVPQESLKIAPTDAPPDAGPSTDTSTNTGGGGGGTNQQTTADDLKIDSGKKVPQPKKKKRHHRRDAGDPSDTGGSGGAGETNL